jgi:drug/metabolite transporter (DMT)-like permease
MTKYYIIVIASVFLNVVGQVFIKKGVDNLIINDISLVNKIFLMVKSIFSTWIFLGFSSVFLASIFWMFALTKLELGTAYPFMSLSFILILIFGYFFLDESITLYKLLGVLLIMVGVVLVSKS